MNKERQKYSGGKGSNIRLSYEHGKDPRSETNVKNVRKKLRQNGEKKKERKCMKSIKAYVAVLSRCIDLVTQK
jgi:uncharacterized protein YaaR (DUF327 family)